jgi:hypothetical protein
VNAPGATGTLFTFTTAGACTVAVTVESTYRGGVVGEDANAMTVTLPGTLTLSADCFPAGDAHYSDWVTVGKPNCWCKPPQGSGYQCKGDVDGAKTSGTNYRIYSADLNIMAANWKFKTTTPGFNACADVDHTQTSGTNYRVYSNDLNIMAANWKKKDTDLNVGGNPPCGL